MTINELSAADAWRALLLWISKPSAYKKNVAAAELICLNTQQSPDPLHALKDFFHTTNILGECTGSRMKSELSSFLTEKKLLWESEWNGDRKPVGRWVVVRLSIPKNGSFNARFIDVMICDFDAGSIQCLTLCGVSGELDLVPHYTIHHNGSAVKFETNLKTSVLSQIEELFFCKMKKWIANPIFNAGIQSLSLVNQEEYYSLYGSMKKKYCQAIKDIWEESTDPDKFIHEDVAIATYLILIWGTKPQTFVDLGCGNGLLVHILSSEGHVGHGIDVRSRKIWKSYPPGTVLKEDTIVPSTSYLFPGVDWIIGNHSDELTPWIPVMALLSSPSTNFFLLPCCAYEFSGAKFKRTNSSKSQYMDYLDYVEKICTECGFNVSRDRLKIPSTKRICFVSKGRKLSPKCDLEIVHNLVGCDSFSSVENTNTFLPHIKTRDPVEKVRNCTQLDSNFLFSLTLKIFNLLLASPRESASWNFGTPLEIPAIAKSLSKDDLRQLKNECGGLQTFLRNHRHIFMIAEGQVSLRKPEVTDKPKKSWKTKPCWFYSHHPQSCPLEDESCSYLHVKSAQ